MIRGQLYINGQWRDSDTQETRGILNPFGGQAVAHVAEAGRAETKSAILSARRAFEGSDWSKWTSIQRAELLEKLGDTIEQHAEELARLETLDTGKTLIESKWDMADIAELFRYFGALAREDHSETLESPNPNSKSVLVREPIGVCGMILPWNYPLLQAAWKIAPALATGCTMVIKPSEITPLTTLKFVELASQLSIPPGVINLVLGPGQTVGAELAESLDVDLISFTGGVETGKRIMLAAANNVKRVALELGGKNPNIIFADANFDVAVDYALNAVFFHAGQICSAGSRLMVHEDIHDQFVSVLGERIKRIKLGNGLSKDTQMGPLISAAHRKKVENYIRLGVEEGAKLVIGGARPQEPELQSGYFVSPTLFTNCTNEMRIVKEEVFGPVITVERFSDEAEVVARANNTIYGLSAGFWTQDRARIERVSKSLRFGTVWVNDFNVYFARAPWGGYKQSGNGRELGRSGLEEYFEQKHLYENYEPEALKWFGK
ncbi:MAG: aldehyde dehydrogenase family protein [Myxococcota bacterium]|nr:aldehyde dehydrogenase family protein [Myxococcota bacterium]